MSNGVVYGMAFFSQSEENSQVDLFDRNVVNRFSTKGEVLLFSSYAKKVRLQPRLARFYLDSVKKTRQHK